MGPIKVYGSNQNFGSKSIGMHTNNDQSGSRVYCSLGFRKKITVPKKNNRPKNRRPKNQRGDPYF